MLGVGKLTMNLKFMINSDERTERNWRLGKEDDKFGPTKIERLDNKKCPEDSSSFMPETLTRGWDKRTSEQKELLK